jgi:DNA-binding response OmpR family regulator
MAEATVLVVDDNEMNRDMLMRRLKRQEYEVLMAEDGERALEMVAAHKIDLVLLDIMMPKLSGYEVLERLKKDAATHQLPVIMISAVDDLDSVVRCIEMGAEDYLFKPFNPVLLKARVNASLEKYRLRQGVSVATVREHSQTILQAVDALAQMPLTPEQQQQVAVIRQHSHALTVLTNQ